MNLQLLSEISGGFIGTKLDYLVILIYFVVVLGFGLYFGRYTASTKDFFFGGQRFSWWLISFSCVATVVGSYSFIKYSAMGFKHGISSTQTYFNDWFWMPILVLVWIPIIYYKKVQSIPEYLEKRFDRKTRIAATLIIMFYIIGYIGINLFTLGVALNTLLGWEVITGAAVTAGAVALYVYIGGQTAIIMTDLLQGIILLVAGLGLFLVGVYHFGGFGDFWGLLPRSHKFAFSDFNAPADFSFIGIYAQDGLANTGATYLLHQGFIMRFLSMKSVKDARKMAVCWILVLFPLAAIAVSGGGWIAKALVANGEIETEASDAFVNAAYFLCSPGVFGFILAALLAALMSTSDTLINAVSAIFVNDVWRPYIRPGADDKNYLKVAKIASLGAAVLGLALVPWFLQDKSIYAAHAKFTAAVTPPLVIVILSGILWKRFTPSAAFATIIGGGVVVFASFKWDDALVGPFSFGMGPDSYKFMRALLGLVSSGVIAAAVTFITKPKPAGEIVGLTSSTLKDSMRFFKGGEPNRRPGRKAKVTVQIDESLSGNNVAIVCQSALDEMAADAGDLIYASHTRWWYGGLHSVHLKAGSGGEEGLIRICPEDAATAGFVNEQRVVVEKIM